MKERNNHDKSLSKLIMAGVGLSGTILTGASVSGVNTKNTFSPLNAAENSGVQTNFITINDIKNDIHSKKVEETKIVQEEKEDFFSTINDFDEFKEKITEELGYFVSENFNSEISQEEMTLDKLLGRNTETKKNTQIITEGIINTDDEYAFEVEENEKVNFVESNVTKNIQNEEKVYTLNSSFGFREMNPHTRW